MEPRRGDEEGGRSEERSAKGATRAKMVEEMACKRGFVGKRTEPVVRRHLAAPYIFLFLSPLIDLRSPEQSTPPRSPSFLLLSSVQHFHLPFSLPSLLALTFRATSSRFFAAPLHAEKTLPPPPPRPLALFPPTSRAPRPFVAH